MLLLSFVRLLFQFRFQTPAFEPLFQLPDAMTTLHSSGRPKRFEPAADHGAKLIDFDR